MPTSKSLVCDNTTPSDAAIRGYKILTAELLNQDQLVSFSPATIRYRQATAEMKVFLAVIMLLALSPGDCASTGVVREGKIVGGFVLPLKDAAYQVSLIYGGNEHICGGLPLKVSNGLT